MNGSVLGGRYRVEARIGSGGMGEVYRGVDTVLDRTVAIKVLLPQFARDANFVDRFRREAQAAARLNHPNLVGIYDSGADGETQFIVMEFIQGRTLDDFMGSGGRFTVPHAVEVAEKICDALAYAHVAGVIHRDIKPANVMVTRKGEVKVMDFGIARIVAGPQTAPQTSAVLGTAAYISPEQAQGQPVDGRSDIYSLGAVLYEMLTGRPPFTGDSPVAVAYKQVNESPVLPSVANPEVTPLLDAVLMRALAKNPANRYQTADEFRADLERATAGTGRAGDPADAAGRRRDAGDQPSTGDGGAAASGVGARNRPERVARRADRHHRRRRPGGRRLPAGAGPVEQQRRHHDPVPRRERDRVHAGACDAGARRRRIGGQARVQGERHGQARPRHRPDLRSPAPPSTPAAR